MKSKVYPQEIIKVPKFEEANGFYTTNARSSLMSKIRSKNTKPEMMLRKALFQKGIRFRINQKDLAGKPDISIKKYKIAIFIDGEFWHGHKWEEKKHKIKANKLFWIPKIERNMQRDGINNETLKQQGFTVIRFWEKEVYKELDKCLEIILSHLEKAKK